MSSSPTETNHAIPVAAPAATTPRRLAFDHMPKCGGSSFVAYLRKHYPPDQTLAMEGGRRNQETLREFDLRTPEQREAIHLTIGHGARDAFAYIHPDTVRVTCFREPVDRIVSLYRYITREPRHHFYARVHEERMDLDDFLANIHTPETRNFFVQRLSGLGIEAIDADPAFASRAALEGLARDYDIAGSLDRFDAFAAAVARLARLPGGDGGMPRTNAAAEPVVAAALAARTRSRIEDMNRADILFFRELETRVGRRAIDGGRCHVV